MKVLLVGGGMTLYYLCRRFAERGYDVVVVNRDHDECMRLARRLRATVVHGDGSDPRILEEAGAMGTDVVLAVTPNDADNLVICQLASLRYGVPRALALAHDPDNADVFDRLGVTGFSTTDIVGNLIEQRAAVEQITNLLPVGEGRVNVTEVVLEAGASVEGRTLRDLDLLPDGLVAVVLRNGEPIIPHGGTELRAGDRVVLVTLPQHHGRVVKAFSGEDA
ncbi:MAG: NAD-binding protein [Trueperaceae bacterium]